jgi:DnaJ like chaperone protein
MSWLGKMIGGTIGFALGGPIGAVAGAAFGHAFVDKKEDAYLASIPGKSGALSSNEEAQLVFFTAAFSMLAKLCKADGQVTEKEIREVEAFMRKDLQLDATGQETAKNIFRQAIRSQESFDAFAMQFYSVFKTQPNIIALMMDVLFRVGAADGKLADAEEATLRSAAGIFRVSGADFNRLKSKYIRPSDKYFAVLKCDETSSNEEIKKQYRKLGDRISS